jgi:hypothetical protein
MMGLVTPFEPKTKKKGEIRNEKNQRKMKGGHPKKKMQERFILSTASVEGKARWSTTLRRRPGRPRNYSEGYEGAFRLCI